MFRLSMLIAILALLIACGDEENVVNPIVLTYEFEDYVYVDTSVYILLKYQEEGDRYDPEPVINWEYNFGEPFTDVNGNGVYDEGVDIFIMCGCDSNMDLDRNSRYTGPNEEWKQGFRFDDLNGDGEYRYREFNKDYYPLCPYMDLNGNGKHDSVLNCDYNVIKFDDTGLLIDFDINYSFISDSGVTYIIDNSTSRFNKNEKAQFIQTDSSLIFEVFQMVPGIGSYRFPIPIVDAGPVYESIQDSVFIYVIRDDSLFYKKTISLDETLDIDGKTYQNLLKVRFDNPFVITANNDDNNKFNQSYYEFYFSKNIGMLALFYKQNRSETENLFWFDQRVDSIPLMMIQ